MKVLLSTDGSASSTSAMDILVGLSLPPASEVVLLTVIDRQDFNKNAEQGGLSEEQQQMLEQTGQLLQEEAEGTLAAAVEKLQAAGLNCSTQIAVGHPSREIIRAAKDRGADLVVVGSHGWKGVKRFLLGSVSEQVLAYAPCSVLIARTSQQDGLRAGDQGARPWDLLVAYDDSEPSKNAAAFAASLPLGEATKVSIVSVLPLITHYRQDIKQRLSWVWKEKKKHAASALEKIKDKLEWSTPHVTTLLREAEEVSQEILDIAAQQGCDLIVLGDKGKGAVEKFLLGSVTSRIARHAPCSVMVVRQCKK